MEPPSEPDINGLPAGPVLDALVVAQWPGFRRAGASLPAVSTDISAAGALMRYLEVQGWRFLLDLTYSTCRVARGLEWGPEVHGATLPLAITRAVLTSARASRPGASVRIEPPPISLASEPPPEPGPIARLRRRPAG